MMGGDSPHSKNPHVFVILRADAYDEGEQVSEHVVVKKVVSTKPRAEEEVERLNALNAQRGCRYYFEIAQFEKGEV